MQDNNFFMRVEQKYLLSRVQTQALLHALSGRMRVDEHGKHLVQSVYYDTERFDLIRASLDKPAYKEKLRVRSYGVPGGGDPVFIELKRKADGLVYKRRVSMTLQQAERYLACGIRPDCDGQILREIDYFLNLYTLLPAMLISCERIALCGAEDPAFRVTLDADIRCRAQDLSLSRGPGGSRILPGEQTLMEVKTVGALPLWFAQILSALRIYPSSFSKYGRAYVMLGARQTGGLNVA